MLIIFYSHWVKPSILILCTYVLFMHLHGITQVITQVALASTEDVDAAVAAAKVGNLIGLVDGQLFFTHNWEPQIKLSVSFLSGSFLQWTMGNNECQRPWTPHVQVSSVQIKFILPCSIGSQHLDRLKRFTLKACNPSIESPHGRRGKQAPVSGKRETWRGRNANNSYYNQKTINLLKKYT